MVKKCASNCATDVRKKFLIINNRSCAQIALCRHSRTYATQLFEFTDSLPTKIVYFYMSKKNQLSNSYALELE